MSKPPRPIEAPFVGELALRVTHQRNQVLVYLNDKSWFGLTPEQAADFAARLNDHAQQVAAFEGEEG